MKNLPESLSSQTSYLGAFRSEVAGKIASMIIENAQGNVKKINEQYQKMPCWKQKMIHETMALSMAKSPF